MSGKFMTTKFIVMPMLTIIMLLSQVSPAMADIRPKELVSLMNDSPTVAVEIYEQKSTEDKYDNVLASVTKQSSNLRIVSQPKKEYKLGETISLTVQGKYTGKVEYRVSLYNGTTKKTSELWKTPKTGYYYRNWQPRGNEQFNIHWPVKGMEPGYYSMSVYVRKANSTVKYEHYVDTQSFLVKSDGTVVIGQMSLDPAYLKACETDAIYANASAGDKYIGIPAANRPVPTGAPATVGANKDTGRKGYHNWLGLYEVWQLENFPVMRQGVDGIFGTMRSMYGYKMGSLYGNQKDPAFINLYGVDKLRNEFMNNTEVQKQLRALAKETYSDLTGDEPYAINAVMATYFGLTSGHPDGKGGYKFDGNAPISRAEFMALFYRTLWDVQSVYVGGFEPTEKNFVVDMGDAWYSPYVFNTESKCYLSDANGLDKTSVVQPISTLEAIYHVISYFHPEDTWTDTGYKQNFKDTTNTLSYESYMSKLKSHYGANSIKLSEGKIKETILIYSLSSKTLMNDDSYVINLAYQKGYIKPDANGNSNWYKPMTRGEALNLMETWIRAQD